jgi:Glycosyl transferase family 2
MRRICFATFEIAPFTGGGIGTFMKHLLTLHGLDERIEPSLLWYGDKSISETMLKAEYPRCRLYSVDEWSSLDDLDVYPPERCYDHRRFKQSVHLMKALRSIERINGPFDFIEFPDFGGASFATLQEKLLGRAFTSTQIAVRIHSTEAMLRRFDHRPPSWENALVYDLERKCLNDADVVVAALRPVAASVQDALNLPTSWLDRVTVEPHPFLTDSKPIEKSRFSADTPIAFTSKIQWFKAPHLFINGVVDFMCSTPDYKGNAYLLAHVISDELQKHCEALIPHDLRARFIFDSKLPNSTRNSIISKSISVNPSVYESFCNVAYEASCLGAFIVLNEANPAFGKDTPWISGVNCEKFDGSATDLGHVLRNLWQRRSELSYDAVETSNTKTPYWLKDFPPAQTTKNDGKLAVVVIACREFGNALDTVRSLLSRPDLDIEICVAFDTSLDSEEDLAAFSRLGGSTANKNIKITRLDFSGGPAALANLGVRETTADYIAFAQAGAVFESEFLQSSIAALNSNPNYSFVVAQVCRETSDSSEPVVDLIYGELLNSTFLGRNMLGNLEFVGRRNDVRKLAFDEYLDREIAWDFFIRAAIGGNRSIVSNRVDAVVPRSNHDDLPRYFRSHPDSIFVKHGLDTPSFAQFRFVSAR